MSWRSSTRSATRSCRPTEFRTTQKAKIIESRNLGGGSEEEQGRTYEIDTCAPIAELILEAINFAVVRNGFGVDGWSAKFREVDYRSSQAIETIRDTRLRNGSWTLNKYRTEIGEPTVDGGNDAVLVDRQNLVLWSDMQAMSKAVIASKGAPAVAAGETPPGGEPMAPGEPQDGAEPDDAEPGKPVPAETLIRYRARLSEALRAMPLTESGGSAGAKVYDQLRQNFPPASVAWVKDASWSGPRMIPLDQVDTSDRSQWDATNEPGQLKQARKKLRRKLAAGEHSKPAVLVKSPGSAKWVIADGHHRFLAAEAEGEPGLWAYTGRVDSAKGPWQVMAASEEGRDRAA